MSRAGFVDPAETRELRRSVLRPNLAPGQPLPGDELAGAVHFAVRLDDGELASTVFVYPDPCPWQPGATAWHLRQLATWPHLRGHGYGGLAVEACVDHVRASGADLLWCNARERAVPFYRRHGFVGTGELFTDDRHTIPHLRMSRSLEPAG